MTDDLMVRGRGVSLHYPLFNTTAKSLRGAVASRFIAKARDSAPTKFAALREVSFDVCAGDRVAVIGPNGAGKTTLLRTIAGIYTPNAGTLERFGTVLPLFGSLPGVSADATGHENIMLAAYSMGLPREAIPHLTADVEAFTELGDFLSMPIKSYSSGMVARLYFAIATGMTADIFVMDEFSFAAGDKFFKEKAKERAQRQLDRANTVFLASHDDQFLRTICNRALYLSRGRLVAFGDFETVLGEYTRSAA